jgi:hypothetical protein
MNRYSTAIRRGRGRNVIVLGLGLVLMVSAAGVTSASGRGIPKHLDPDQLDAAAVRIVSERFRDIEQAYAEGYILFYQCTEQPGVGTMGQHLVNLDYVGDPAINPLRPEALVYEPTKNGGFELAAVEYVVMAADWTAAFGSATPRVLGQDMLFRPQGNRYGLPDFYERHAWLFKTNPSGMFSDWNPRASCRGTGDNGG